VAARSSPGGFKVPTRLGLFFGVALAVARG
jgi:hypothetical protein